MLYAVAGNGTGNLTEIKATLADLRDKAVADEAEFWLILQGKEDLTKTDTAILKWLRDEGIWFEVAGEESDTYEGAQEFHEAPLVDLMQAHEDEGVVFLTLFVDSDNPDTEEDGELFAQFEAADEVGIEVRLLNSQLQRIQLKEDEPEAEPDEEPEGEPETQAFTEAELKKMSPPELKAVAKGQGITIPPKSLKADIIALILGAPVEEAAPAATVTGVATAGAMLVVVMNGTVHIKPISVEEAQALV